MIIIFFSSYHFVSSYFRSCVYFILRFFKNILFLIWITFRIFYSYSHELDTFWNIKFEWCILLLMLQIKKQIIFCNQETFPSHLFLYKKRQLNFIKIHVPVQRQCSCKCFWTRYRPFLARWTELLASSNLRYAVINFFAVSLP